MGYRTFVSLNIAVIGDCKLSEDITEAFVVAGHEVFIANKDGASLPPFGMVEGSGKIHTCNIETAAAEADFIIIATAPQDVREVAYWLGDVRRKVIIDLSPNMPGTGQERINTVGAISSITGSPHIVKALSIHGFEHLFGPLFGGASVQVLLSGDSLKAKEITKIIARELGVQHFYDFGGSDTFGLFDEMAKCCQAIISRHQKELQPVHAA